MINFLRHENRLKTRYLNLTYFLKIYKVCVFLTPIHSKHLLKSTSPNAAAHFSLKLLS